MTSQTSPITVEARAKVNLYLHVVGKRPDGYHLLDSLIAFGGAADTLTFALAPTLSLTVDGPTAALLPAGETNIVERAARLLAEAAGIPAAAAIHLTKRLPVAAGIGGGSADAAAALTGLSRLWGVHLPADRMAALALSLGADVPMCLDGRALTVSGVGEVLAPAPKLPPVWILLVNPMVPCHTPAVFKARQGGFGEPDPLTEAPKDAADLARALAGRANQLTEAAIGVVPDIARVLDAISAQTGCLLARMSGSGATCFGLFARAEDADDAAQAIKKMHPNWWCASAPLESN